MDKSVFLYWWFSFDLQYYLILGGTNNVLHISIKTFLCTMWSLALAKKSCNNINNSRAQVSRLCYFLRIWLNRQKTAVKKKITYFLKNYVAYLFTFFKFMQIFYVSVCRCKILRPFIFSFVWSSIHSIGIFFARRKYADLVVISNIGRGGNFCGIFTISQSCVYIKYWFDH